jgi:glycosyltransferase involved in cell wall biosynthesis
MKKILAISTSPFPYGDNATDGPGYRAWNLLQKLAQKNEVVIFSLYESFHLRKREEFEIEEEKITLKFMDYGPKNIAQKISQENPDVLYLPWSSTPFLSRLKTKIPTILDYVGAGLLEEFAVKGYIPITLLQMKLKSFWFGDLLLTAGQRERYYLIGLMAASKKLTLKPHNPSDPLIHVIPMTPPIDPPILKQNVIQKKSDEFVLLVAGAFLRWYDYVTLFKALEILIEKEKKNFKIIFMGGNQRDSHFENEIRKMGNTNGLSERLFFSGIVPFKMRADYYLKADVAVNIPANSIEDQLSVRTRIVDYIWAGLPIISPAKDEYSSAVVSAEAGFQYEVGNPRSLANVISTLIDNPKKLEKAKSQMSDLLQNEFNIEKHISPIESFIANPQIDPARKITQNFASDLFLWIRDARDLVKR